MDVGCWAIFYNIIAYMVATILCFYASVFYDEVDSP